MRLFVLLCGMSFTHAGFAAVPELVLNNDYIVDPPISDEGSQIISFSLDAGDQPVSVSSGDLNNDNSPDLVAANLDSNTISVFLGNGNGGYFSKVDYTTGLGPFSVTTGDFNSDTYADLAVVSLHSETVSIFINHGDGSFSEKVDYSTGLQPHSVASGDFNGDTYLDLAVANAFSDTVSIFFNNGDGTYATKIDYVAGSVPFSVVSGDFDGINGLDLAVANSEDNSVSVFLNNGDGSYAAKVDYETGENPWSVISSDFNGDAQLDLAVSNLGSDSVSVFLNIGSGSFATKVDYATEGQPSSVTSSDYDGVNGSDIAVANRDSGSFSILLNNGDGSFSTKVDYTTAVPWGITSGDFDGVNGNDLVVANGDNATVSVFLNIGNGRYVSNVDSSDGLSITERSILIASGVRLYERVVLSDSEGVSGGVSLRTIVTEDGPQSTDVATTFTDLTNVPLNTPTVSNTVTISGLSASSAVSISGGEYSLNAAAYTSDNGTINNGDTVSVRLTSSSDYFTTMNAVLTIGATNYTFNVTTLTDTVPDVFSFTDQADVPLSTLVTSDTLTIGGLGASAMISVSGGEYSINGGDFVSIDGFINDNDTVVVRQTSSADDAVTTDTVLTIGGVSDIFSVTTTNLAAITDAAASGSDSSSGTGPISLWLLTGLGFVVARRNRYFQRITPV